MANPEVNLTKRVTIPGRGSRWCPVALAANGKVKPDIVIVNGVEERHPEGTYYIDWHEGGRRRRLAVGQNATDAHARRLAKEAELNARNHGVAIVATEPNGHGRPLPAAVADFLELTTMTESLDLHFEQVRIAEGSSLDGRQIKDSRIRSEHNAMIVAITTLEGEMIFNPNGEQTLHAGDLLIAIGTSAGLQTLAGIASGR